MCLRTKVNKNFYLISCLKALPITIKTNIVKKIFYQTEEIIMPYRFFLGLLGALLISSPAKASEDMESVMFGAEPPVETADTDKTAVQSPSPSEDMPEAMDFMDGSEDESIWGEEGNPENFAPVTSDSVASSQDKASEGQSSSLSNEKTEDILSSKSEEKDIQEASPQIKKGQDLTDTLKNDSAQPAPKIPLPKVEGTWVNKLTSSNPLDLLSGEKNSASELEKLVKDARQEGQKSKRSNASVFDISGVMLRMGLSQVDETMQNRGFQKIMQKYQVPNFIKWRNEEYCRRSGVVGFERTQACVVQKAKKDNHQYVQTTKYAKYDTKEEIEVTFTSNFTENKVYKIEYSSQASNITGNSQKAIYLRNIKIYDFWKKINQKYGKPDDKESVIWGMGGNKPYLKAKTGWLLLEDPMLRELDYTRMSREDQRYLNTDLYSF